jgi:chromosome segregation ATPase
MAKGKNERGKTNRLNPHFEKMQDLAFETFKDMGFKRGESKSITNKDHLEREQFVKQKITQLEKQGLELSIKNKGLLGEFEAKQKMFEEVTAELDKLKSHLGSLRNQVSYICSLKTEMFDALEQGSEFSLRQFIEEKLAPALLEAARANQSVGLR